MNSPLLAVSIDCADAARLAAYWSAILERPIDEGATEDFASIGMAPREHHPVGVLTLQVVLGGPHALHELGEPCPA